MNSIYLRSISKDLRTLSPLDIQKGNYCDHCKKDQCIYKLGIIKFCSCACANAYHLRWDIAAVTHSSLSLLWFVDYLNCDVVTIIAKSLYNLRKRETPPIFKCVLCGQRVRDHDVIFVDTDCFCGRYCKNRLYSKKTNTINKSPTEINTKYIW